MPFISSVRGSYGPKGRFGALLSSLLNSTGGAITTAGGYRIHTFATGANSGATQTFTSSGSGTLEYLIVAGGGGGGQYGGGGGAGGYLTGTGSVTAQNYSVVIGAAGIRPSGSGYINNPTSGENSSFNSIVAFGGGYGSTWNALGGNPPGANGGAGGGGNGHMGGGGGGAGGAGADGDGQADRGTGGIGTVGPPRQGYNGGKGQDSGAPNIPGNGGVGLSNSISGSGVFYAGGGGGCGHSTGNQSVGGNGGGGAGRSSSSGAGAAGVNGRGGGGGGGLNGVDDQTGNGTEGNGWDGGSGVVIIRYAI